MMRVSELQGAHLDYWTARAEGIPDEQLTIRRVQRSTDCHVVWMKPPPAGSRGIPHDVVLAYSTDWAHGGPLIEKHDLVVGRMGVWHAIPWGEGARGDNWIDAGQHDGDQGATPLQAICRAVVRAAFGDEVPDINE